MQTSHAPPKQSIAGATTNHEPPAEKVWPVQPHLSAPPCIPKYPPPSNSSWKSIPSLERNKYVLCIIYDCIYIWIPLHCIYMKVNFKGSCFFVKPTRNLSLFPGSTWLASPAGDHHCLNNFHSAADGSASLHHQLIIQFLSQGNCPCAQFSWWWWCMIMIVILTPLS